MSLVGGLSALDIGILADRNRRRMMMGLFAAAGLAAVGAALSPTYLLLMVAILFGGLALGAGNSVTNRIVARHISIRPRGLVIGIKQAGPPLGIFLAGIAMQVIAVATNWRVALSIAVLPPVVGPTSSRQACSGIRRVRAREACWFFMPDRCHPIVVGRAERELKVLSVFLMAKAETPPGVG